MGQIMAFGFRQRACRARPVRWLWNECRKKPQQRQLVVDFRRLKSTVEIPGYSEMPVLQLCRQVRAEFPPTSFLQEAKG
jgi:hypothetical protein